MPRGSQGEKHPVDQVDRGEKAHAAGRPSLTDQPTPSSAPTQIEIQQQEQLAIATAALRGAAPRLYANGFIVAQSNSDVSIIMLTNGSATSVLTLSFIAAKTLIGELTKAMTNLEEAIGETIPTMDEIQEKMKKAAEARHESR
jgi:hypothetical protein